MRQWSLYARQRGGKTWTRISLLTHSKAGMVRTCQNIMLASFGSKYELRLRPFNGEEFNEEFSKEVMDEIR